MKEEVRVRVNYSVGLRLVQENEDEVILARVRDDGTCKWEGKDGLARIKYRSGRLTVIKILNADVDFDG